MGVTSIANSDEWIQAWLEFNACIPISPRQIKNERDFRTMVGFPDNLLDRIGDQEAHPLIGLLDIVTEFVHAYEEQNVEIPQVSPSTVLRFLVAQHDFCPADLMREFGTHSRINNALLGKHEINAKQARSLAKRFRVSPKVFI